MHLWQNPLHMSRCKFKKQNTTLRRFLKPFRARAPAYPTSTSTLAKYQSSVLRLFLKFCDASIQLCKSLTPIAFLTLYNRGGKAIEHDIQLSTGSRTAIGNSIGDSECAAMPAFQSRSAWFFNGTPKKLREELQPCFNNDSNPPVGWALFFDEDFSTPPILFLLLTCHIVICLIFLIATGVKMPGISVEALFSIPALILTTTTFSYSMVSKNCECTKKSRD